MNIKKGAIVTACAVAFASVVAISVISSKAGSSDSKTKDFSVDSNFEAEEGYFEGEIELTAEDEEWVEENVIPVDSEKELDSIIEDNQASDVEVELDKDTSVYNDRSPNEVDNSNSIYFPQIGNQESYGSCVAWSVGYYQFTYMYNRAIGRAVDDEAYVSSPSWIYNFINNGNDNGATYADALKLLRDVGSVSIDDIPYDSSKSNFITDVHAEEKYFREAFNNQVAGYYTISIGNADSVSNTTPITGPDDSDLNLIKAGLDKGEIFTASTKSRRWIYSQIEKCDEVPENDYYVGEYIVTRSDANITSGHRVTIVGYNDEIWVDINENGIVEEGEKGAFKIANSWGSNWASGNDGFIWVSYDAINFISSVTENSNIDLGSEYRYSTLYQVIGMKLKDNQEPSDCYMKFTLNTSEIGAVNVDVLAVESDGSYHSYNVVPFKNSDLFLSMGYSSPIGETTACDGTFMIDLDNVISNITPDRLNDYSWTVTVGDCFQDSVSVTVKDVSLINDQTGEEIYTTENNVVLNNNSVDLVFGDNNNIVNGNTITVYYSGFDTPYIHYQVDLGEWTTVPGVKMQATSELEGYTHKCVLNIGTGTLVTACFNDGNGNWDNKNNNNYDIPLGIFGIKNGKMKSIDPDDIVVATPTPSPTDEPIPTVNPTVAPATEMPVVTASPSGITTIYYKGYNTPYIHYKVGNGNWTDVPGKAMIATTEMSGYTHKYDIDMGDSSSVTVCFNDGNNNWDSANGSNYTFGLGTYTYTNGTINTVTPVATSTPATASPTNTPEPTVIPATSTPEPTTEPTKEPDELKVNLSIDGNVKVGNQVSVIASATGGVAPYKCSMGFNKDEIDSESTLCSEVILEEDKNYAISYTFETGGKYEFFVIITDSQGNEITTSEVCEVDSFEITGINTSLPSPQYAGLDIELTPLYDNYYMEDGNAPDVTFKISNGVEESTLIYDGQNKESVIWNTSVSGTYTIIATAIDVAGSEASYTMEYVIREYDIKENICTIYYKGYSSPYIHYQLEGGNWTSVPGVKMEACNDMEGYTHKISINMGEASSITACFNDGNGNWDSNNGNNYVFEVGTYKYNNGNIKSVTDTPNEVTIYYKGYAKPYIHYKVGAGSWTSVPGVAMTSTSEMSGYTHMATIDMGYDTSVIACFNDGNGNWDSNNGSNYTFGTGVYAYSGGVIKKIE